MPNFLTGYLLIQQFQTYLTRLMNLIPPYQDNSIDRNVVDLGDAAIYYEMYGNGEPLLLLHGNNQSGKVFEKQVDELSQQFKVIVPDTRGHGNSTDQSTVPLTYQLFADDMVKLLDSLELKNVNILGWSDGGITGLIMAMKYPEYVKRLAIMGANLSPDGLKDIVFRDVRELIADLEVSSEPGAPARKRIYELILNEPHVSAADLQKIEAPVLVMAGQNDIVWETHTAQIAESIPNSQLTIFSKAGHFAPVYNAFEFNQEVLEFFMS